jgi:hypothetical protein
MQNDITYLAVKMLRLNYLKIRNTCTRNEITKINGSHFTFGSEFHK